MITTLSYLFLATRVQSHAISLLCGHGMNGASVRVVTAGSEPGGQWGAQPVGRVHVAAEYHDRDVAGARALQGGGRGLGAGARNPGVVEEQDSSRPRPFGYKAVRVGVTALLPRPDGQPGPWQPQVRAGH